MNTRLYTTPLSHFGRKVRIVLQELEIPHELIFVPNLLSSDPADFGGNPILRIPTLVDAEHWIVESDQIARYVVERYDPKDRLGCLVLDPDQRNLQAMINAAMGAEVEILLSGRSGIENVDTISYFRRYFEVIRNCLRWLDTEGAKRWTTLDFSYLDIALICMWDHLRYYDTVPELEQYSWIGDRVSRFAERASVLDSAPRE